MTTTLAERVRASLVAQGDAPDYQRLVADVLGIRGAPPALARRLVEQALLVTDWEDRWRAVGAAAVERAPAAPGVYVFRDGAGCALYVGKAVNLRRRLRSHFSSRRWRALPPPMARVATVECEPLGSELEAILREQALIEQLSPVVNVQTAAPSMRTRALSRAIVRDVVLLLPSIDTAAVEIVAARTEGGTATCRVPREGDCRTAAEAIWTFFAADAGAGARHAPLVFSWLAGRGQGTSRLDPRDSASASDLERRLRRAVRDPDLFVGRVITQP